MLPLVLLAVVIALVAMAGGTVVWLVLSGILAPEIAAIGSSIVLIGSSLALATLILRLRARRAERELHTVRRSQSIREREPLRYDLDETADLDSGGPDLVHPMPAAPVPPREEPSTAFAVGDTALWLEAVVLMPSNETVAWRALPGDRDAARESAEALPPEARAGAELRVIEAVLSVGPQLREPILCAVSPALLGDRDAAMELRRMAEAEPALATRLIIVANPSELDELAGGRLDDLVDEGMGLAVERLDLAAMDRASVGRLAERGAGMVLVRAGTLDPATAARPLRWLMEAGIEPVAIDVTDEDAMLRIADLGIVRFAGPAFGSPRRARDRDVERDREARAVEPEPEPSKKPEAEPTER